MIPPQSIDSEESVLGGILLDSTKLDELSWLSKDDFYRDGHKTIYKAMQDLYSHDKPVDVITLSLKLGNKLQEVGGSAYLARLNEYVATAANISHYAKIVKELSIRRQAIEVANRLITKVSDSKYKTSESVNEAVDKLLTVNNGNVKKKNIADQVFDTMGAIYAEKSGIETGVMNLDFMLGGLQPGELIILAGRPSMGKSAMALNIIKHNVIDRGKSVALYSLEMTATSCIQRMMANMESVPIGDFKNTLIGKDEAERINNAATQISESKLSIVEENVTTVQDIAADSRKIKRERGLDLIVIDHITLLAATGRHDNRTQEVSVITRTLKLLAKSLGIPIIALSQLSRAVEQRNNKRPIMSDLRESGSIEQDADVVMFMYRDEYYYPDTDKKGIAEIIVSKQRNGETGAIETTWLPRYQRFVGRE